MQFNGDCQMLSGVQRFPIEKTIYVWNVFMIRWWLRRRTRQIFGTFSQYKILSMAMVNQFVLSYIGTWKPVCFIPAKLPCKVWYKVFIYHKIKSFCMYRFKWDTIVKYVLLKFSIPNK